MGLTFSRNSATDGGGALLSNASYFDVYSCVFTGNSTDGAGAAIMANSSSELSVEDVIIAFSTAGEAIVCNELSSATLSCCDVFGNAGGDYVDCVAGQEGVDGNINADPEFCSSTPDDDENWSLQSDSPCVTAGECGVIGNHGVSCGTTLVIETSWSAIKARFD